jgi:WD40 repeat protein
VSFWDVATGRLAGAIAADLSGWPVWEFTFSADGRLLAASGDGLVKVWESATGRERLGIPVSSNKQFRSGPIFSPDGRWLVFRSEEPGGCLRVWDLEEGRDRAYFRGPRAEMHRFSPDGKLLVFESWEPKPGQVPAGIIRRWDSETGTELPPLEEHAGPLRVLAFSPDGRSLAAGERKRWQWTGTHKITLWVAASGEKRGIWEVPLGVNELRFTADGAWLLVRFSQDAPDRARGPELIRIDLAGPRDQEMTPLPFAESLSPDGRLLACCVSRSQEPVTIRELPGGQELAQLSPLRSEESLFPSGFTSDGRLLAVIGTLPDPAPHPILDWLRSLFGSKKAASQEAALHLFATDTGAWQGSVPVAAATRTWFTPDGKTLVVYGPESRPTLWDLPLRRPWVRILIAWALLAGYFTAARLWLRGRTKMVPPEGSAVEGLLMDRAGRCQNDFGAFLFRRFVSLRGGTKRREFLPRRRVRCPYPFPWPSSSACGTW